MMRRVPAGFISALLLVARPAFATTEREVTFDGAGGVRISATLALPAGASAQHKVPALVLVAGSGPTDRNGNQPPLLWTGLLKQTADLLAGAGVASLRYDKRGVGRSDRPPKDRAALSEFVRWEHFVDDVVAASVALQGQPEVDASRVALLGHSEGGLLVMDATVRLQDGGRPPAAVVLVATPGRPLGVLLREQLAGMSRRLGVSEAGTSRWLARNDEIIAAIRTTGVVPDDVPQDLAGLYPPYAGKFLQVALESDPAAVARRLTVPVLVIQGAKDLQVSAERDATALEAALKGRPGSVRSDVVILEGASHNLKRVERGGEHAAFGPVVPSYGAKLVAWIDELLCRHAGS
jgi:pimeloyl-ACP methyl ester carboxylesterase